MSPSPHHDHQTRGYVIPIGGAEERTGSMKVLRRFVKLCGGRKANIVIIPTASSLDDTGDRYIEIFGKIGAANAVSYRSANARTRIAKSISSASRARPESLLPAVINCACQPYWGAPW